MRRSTRAVTIRIAATPLLALALVACERDESITDFENEFGDYRSELKVEGVLQVDRPADSIVRVTRTSTILESDVYNGIDDDNDGDIDELDEVLPLVQDTSATVTFTNLSSGEEIRLVYQAAADSVVRFEEEGGDEGTLVVPYGGYKPVDDGFAVEAFARYRLRVDSRDFGVTITGETTAYPPVQFLDTLHALDEGRLVMGIDDEKEVFWRSEPDITAYYVTVVEVEPDGKDGVSATEIVAAYVASRDNGLSRDYGSVSIGWTVLFDLEGSIEYRLTIDALSPSLGRYVFSDLPLKDPQRSNLRDQNGDPVMGAFGAAAAQSVLITVED